MPECPNCNKQHHEGLVKCAECADALEDTYAWMEKTWSPVGKYIEFLFMLERIAFFAFALLTFPFAFVYRTRRYWPLYLAFGLFVIAQWSFPFADWWRTWMKKNSYYSHGPLVPLIALFMIGANHKRMARLKIQPSWLGLLLIIPSVPLFVFGRWTGSGNMCAITFLTFLVGAVLLYTGTRMTRLLLFPILYLAFMVPAPSTVLDRATFPVQYGSTTLAAKILDHTGYAVHQSGTVITGSDLPDALRVAGECSGFRMLISLLTFTAFFVYMVRAPLWKKAFLVLFSFPLSLFVNGLRIAVIGYVGIWTESAEAMMNFHNSWAMIFELVISFAILFGIAKLIKANDFGIPEPKIDLETAALADRTPAYKVVGRGLRGPAVIVFFCLVILSNMLIKPLETSARGHINRPDFPRSFGNWISQEIPPDQITKEELKTADLLDRQYINTADDTQVVYHSIQAARDTDAFHDPHSCLPGGGNSISEDRPIIIKFDRPKPMQARATLLRFSNDDNGEEYLLVYWYNTGRDSYPSTSEVRLKMRQAQVKDLTGIAKSWFGIGDGKKLEQELAQRQTYCYRFQTPVTYEETGPKLKQLEEFIREYVANAKHFDR